MFNKKRWMQYSFMVAIIIIILICSLGAIKLDNESTAEYEIPVYDMFISENGQRDIWEQCDKNKLSYELVLAIYEIEGENTFKISNIKEEVVNLAYYRDYWTEKGFPDEVVFNLMLLSKDRGLEGCTIFMKANDSYDLDNYVKEVTKYKCYLEQTNYTGKSSQI